jgi:hypothetical protein
MGTKNLRHSGVSITEMPLTGFKRDEDGYFRMITRASTKEIIGGKVTRGKELVSEQRYVMGTIEDHLYKFDIQEIRTNEPMTVYFRPARDETS